MEAPVHITKAVQQIADSLLTAKLSHGFWKICERPNQPTKLENDIFPNDLK